MIIASLNLLDSGNIEFVESFGDVPGTLKNVNRLLALENHWESPELQALLDRLIEADKGGVPFE
jgi:hypothetical protein